MEFDFLRFRRGNVPPGKVGKGESLAIWSWRQSEVQLAELGDPKAGGDTLLERLLFWVDWKSCHIVCAQQQKGNIRASCYITLTPPAVSVRLLSFSNCIPQESSTPFLFWDRSKKQPEQTHIICCMNTLLAAKAGWISPWLSSVRTCQTELPMDWRKSEYSILLKVLKELGSVCVYVCWIILYKASRECFNVTYLSS